ncbi:MAG: hypothetical protein WCI93_02550 [bacterium]
MKKYLYIVAIVCLSFCSHNVFATSGACSDHGGVNCYISMGLSSISGNAICNDGFESSVRYADMDECIVSTPTVSYCSSSYPTKEYNYYLYSPLIERQAERDSIPKWIASEQAYIDGIKKTSADSLSSSIQSTKDIFNKEIAEFQADKDKAVAQAQASYYTNNPMGSGSDGQQYILNIGSKYDVSINKAKADMDYAIKKAQIDWQINDNKYIFSAQQCISQLTQLALDLDKAEKNIISGVALQDPDGNSAQIRCKAKFGANSIPDIINHKATAWACTCANGFNFIDNQCVVAQVVSRPQVVPASGVIAKTIKTPKQEKQIVITSISQQSITQPTQIVNNTDIPIAKKKSFWQKLLHFFGSN